MDTGDRNEAPFSLTEEKLGLLGGLGVETLSLELKKKKNKPTELVWDKTSGSILGTSGWETELSGGSRRYFILHWSSPCTMGSC